MQSPDEARHHLPIGMAAAVVLFLAGVTYVVWPLLPTLADAERTRELIAEAGVWAPVVFIGIQILQVMIAPVPGQASVLAGGYLFGPYLGLLYALVGATVGTTIVFVLSRTLGRPFVTHFVRTETLDRFDVLAERRGALVFFLIFLFPALPDDVVAFAAGLTKIPIARLVLVCTAGRLPGYIVLSLVGHGMTSADLRPVVAVLAATAALFAIAAWHRSWILRLIDSGDGAAFIRSAVRDSWPRVLAAASVGAALAVAIYLLAVLVFLR